MAQARDAKGGPTRALGVMVDEAPKWYQTFDRLHPVLGPLSVAFIDRRQAGSDLHRYVLAALVAADSGLRSLDHVMRNYVGDAPTNVASIAEDETDVLLETYELVVRSMSAARERLVPNESTPPTLGEFAASIALERLAASFKSAHVLYRLGHCTDGDAIARVILEQSAWAYSAGPHDSIESVEGIRPSRAVTKLRELHPDAGRLYGFLSKRVHLDVSVHRESFWRDGDRNLIAVTQQCLEHACGVLLRLCDIYLAVWDATQAPHLSSLESVVREGDVVQLRGDRPFKARANEQLVRARLHAREEPGDS